MGEPEGAGGGARGYSARRFGPRATMLFVRALEDGATVAQAAAKAGIDRSTAYHRRDCDPPFRDAWNAAAEKSRRPWLITARNGRKLQKWKPRPMKFTLEAKEAFLAFFSATGDEEAAAEAAGVCQRTVYNHRRTDPEFAQGWAEALDQSYARLEAELVRQRVAALRRMRTAIDEGAAAPAIAVEFERAMAVLKRYDRGRDGRARARTSRVGGARKWSFAEAVAALEQKLGAMGYEIDESQEPERPDDGAAA